MFTNAPERTTLHSDNTLSDQLLDVSPGGFVWSEEKWFCPQGDSVSARKVSDERKLEIQPRGECTAQSGGCRRSSCV